MRSLFSCYYKVCVVSRHKITFISHFYVPLRIEFYKTMTVRKIIRKLTNRYVIATLVFVLVIVFFDQFNLKKQVELHRELKAQEAEINHLNTNIGLYRDSLQMVTEDPDGMERIGREKYYMKRDDEVVYQIRLDE